MTDQRITEERIVRYCESYRKLMRGGMDAQIHSAVAFVEDGDEPPYITVDDVESLLAEVARLSGELARVWDLYGERTDTLSTQRNRQRDRAEIAEAEVARLRGVVQAIEAERDRLRSAVVESWELVGELQDAGEERIASSLAVTLAAAGGLPVPTDTAKECEHGCGCRYGTTDPDAKDCACNGPCSMADPADLGCSSALGGCGGDCPACPPVPTDTPANCGNCGEPYPGEHIIENEYGNRVVICPRHTAVGSLSVVHDGFIAQCDTCAAVPTDEDTR